MRSRWSDEEAAGFVTRYGPEWGEPLALRTYSSRLLGAEPDLVLHGGGNSSVKGSWKNVFGEALAAIFVKASGADMATIEPAGHSRARPGVSAPSAGASHAGRRRHGRPAAHPPASRRTAPRPPSRRWCTPFFPRTFIDHTHADAVLALTNRADGEAAVREALGDDVIVLPYVTPASSWPWPRRSAGGAARSAGHGVGASRHGHLGRHGPGVVRGDDRAGVAGGAIPGLGAKRGAQPPTRGEGPGGGRRGAGSTDAAEVSRRPHGASRPARSLGGARSTGRLGRRRRLGPHAADAILARWRRWCAVCWPGAPATAIGPTAGW